MVTVVAYRPVSGLNQVTVNAPRSSMGNSTSTKSTFNLRSVFTPMRRGEPRRAATISSGKCTDLKTKAKEPSYVIISTRFGYHGETTHKLLDDGLDELGEVETFVGLAIPDVFAEHGNGLGVGIGAECIASFVQDELEFFVCESRRDTQGFSAGLTVGDDTV